MLKKKKEFKKFRKDFDKTLSDLLDEYGFKMEQGNIRYDDFQMSFKVTFKDGGDLDEEDFKRKEFEKMARHFMGIDSEDYGQIFESHGRKFKIVALNKRAKKYPLITKCLDDGKQYKMPLKEYTGEDQPFSS